MKKLTLVAGGLLLSFELLAGNFVPVCLNVGDNQKVAVYNAIVENSFVTQLDSKRAAKLSEEDKKEIINDESGFLKNKIQSADPSAKVAFIPKSLYQLFVWNYYLNDIVSQTRNSQMNQGQIFRLIVCNPVWGNISAEAKIGFGDVYKTPENISDFCGNYMENEDVKRYFWEINNSIIPFFRGISAEQVDNLEDLGNITNELFENISPNAKKVPDLVKGFFTGHRLLIYAKDLVKKDFVKAVTDLIVEESKTPESSYRIYRGESSTDSDRDPGVSYSFSDGMFGGIIRDWDSGMAFNYSLSKLHMKIVDLPKENLLNIKENFDGIETSGLSIHIPPVISMGAALGAGEFHHVRTKVMVDPAKKDIELSSDQGVNIGGDASAKGTPWIFSYSSPVADFWEKLELTDEQSYNVSYKKDLNVKTYRWNSKK